MELATKYTVYRLYGAEDNPLYVGCTKRLKTRLHQHAKSKEWWPEVAEVVSETFASAEDAADAEQKQVRELSPRYNVTPRYRDSRATRGRSEFFVPAPGAAVLDAAKVDMTALRDLREDQAYSVRELADMAGISRTTLWKLETTGGKAHPRTIRKLAEALEVKPRDIIKRTR